MKLEEFLGALSVRQPEVSKARIDEIRGEDDDALIEGFNKALASNDEANLSAIGKTLFCRFHSNLKRTSNAADSLQEMGNMMSLIYHKLQ